MNVNNDILSSMGKDKSKLESKTSIDYVKRITDRINKLDSLSKNRTDNSQSIRNKKNSTKSFRFNNNLNNVNASNNANFGYNLPSTKNENRHSLAYPGKKNDDKNIFQQLYLTNMDFQNKLNSSRKISINNEEEFSHQFNMDLAKRDKSRHQSKLISQKDMEKVVAINDNNNNDSDTGNKMKTGDLINKLSNIGNKSSKKLIANYRNNNDTIKSVKNNTSVSPSNHSIKLKQTGNLILNNDNNLLIHNEIKKVDNNTMKSEAKESKLSGALSNNTISSSINNLGKKSSKFQKFGNATANIDSKANIKISSSNVNDVKEGTSNSLLKILKRDKLKTRSSQKLLDNNEDKFQNSGNKNQSNNDKNNDALNIFKGMAASLFQNNELTEDKDNRYNKQIENQKSNISSNQDNDDKEFNFHKYKKQNSNEDDRSNKSDKDIQLKDIKELQEMKNHNLGIEIAKAEGNIFIPNNIIAKDAKNQIFWTKKEIREFQSKVRLAGEKIREKQKKDFDELEDHIYKNEKEDVIRILKDDDFRAFYKLELKKPHLIEKIFLHQMPDVVVDLIEYDPMIFSFSKTFVFTYIERVIKKKEYFFSEEDIETNFMNIVKYNLYDKKHASLLLWFYAHFNYKEEFNLILEKNPDCGYNNVHNDNDENYLTTYSETKEIYIQAIKQCLSFGFEDLAIALIFFFKIVNDASIIETAVFNGNLRYLQVIWERYNDQVVSSNNLFNSTSNKSMDMADDDSLMSEKLKKMMSSQSSKSERSGSHSMSNKSSSSYRKSKMSSSSKSRNTIINPEMNIISKLEITEVPFTISELVLKLHKLDRNNQI